MALRQKVEASKRMSATQEKNKQKDENRCSATNKSSAKLASLCAAQEKEENMDFNSAFLQWPSSVWRPLWQKVAGCSRADHSMFCCLCHGGRTVPDESLFLYGGRMSPNVQDSCQYEDQGPLWHSPTTLPLLKVPAQVPTLYMSLGKVTH